MSNPINFNATVTDGNYEWADLFLRKLQGDPFGVTWSERNGYRLRLAYDKVRRNFRIVNPRQERINSGRFYLITTVARLVDAVRSHYVAPGEESELWSEYRRTYKSNVEHIQEHLEPEFDGDFYQNGSACVWHGVTPEWAAPEEEPVILKDRKGRDIVDDSQADIDKALLDDTQAQCNQWLRESSKRRAYYWTAQFAEEIDDLKVQAMDQCSEELMRWMNVAETRLEEIGEPDKTTITEFTRLNLILTMLNNVIIARDNVEFTVRTPFGTDLGVWNGWESFNESDELFMNRD